MPRPTKGARLGGSAAHEKLLLANLAKALFEHGRITTTEAKARKLRPYAERLVTKAKKAAVGEAEAATKRSAKDAEAEAVETKVDTAKGDDEAAAEESKDA